jgi:UDP-GlcNAc:undecaprenyl-phosphate GlcNAc-1-phosphate transferase
LLSAYLSFYIAGVYRGVWRYIGLNDLLRFAQVSLVSVILTVLIIKILYGSEPYTYDVFLLYSVFLFLGLAASRSSFRILDRVYDLQKIRTKKENVLLIGAEDAGEFALRWLLRNIELGFNPVGFIDNDPLKKGRMIHGVSVLGVLDDLEKILVEKNVDGVIVSNGVREVDNNQLLDICRNRGVWLRVLRLEFELIE